MKIGDCKDFMTASVGSESREPSNETGYPIPDKNWLKRLIECVWYLGFSLGWRYWRIEQMAWKHPEKVLEWARSCRIAAITANEPYRSSFMSWADKLEDNFEEWKKGAKN